MNTKHKVIQSTPVSYTGDWNVCHIKSKECGSYVFERDQIEIEYLEDRHAQKVFIIENDKRVAWASLDRCSFFHEIVDLTDSILPELE